MKNPHRRFAITGAIALSLSATLPVAAQDVFPSRGVRIILPFAPGSILDTLTRIVAEGLSRKWNQSVVVENIAGSGGNAGTERFARSTPDGYTLLAAPPGPLTMNRLLFKDIGYDAATFVPVSLMGTVTSALVVRKDFPAKNFEEFVAYARANPGRVSFASQGLGSTPYLTAKLLEAKAKVEMVHVPYRGSSLAQTDLAAGHIDCFFDAISNALPVAQAGNARILAITDFARSPLTPDAPLVADFYPGFRSISWFALALPAGTPAAIASKISADVAEIVAAPTTNARLRDTGLVTVGSNPAETAKFIIEEDAKWAGLIRDLGLQPQ